MDLNGNEIQVSNDTPVRTVNGVHYLLTKKERDESAVKTAAWEAETTKRNALAEIRRLESQVTPRRLCEAILGIDNGWLAQQNDLIVAERKKITLQAQPVSIKPAKVGE